MLKILLRTLLLCFLTGTVSGCYEEDQNRFRPGSTHLKPNPEEPVGNTGYESLTADNHPRLLMNAADFDALKAKIAANTDANLTLLHNTILSICTSKGMSNAALTYKLDSSNKRILDVSRNALLRIFTCAYAYRLTGDAKYLTHAESDINAVCNFPDWNAKRHFLDVGEMAAAVALGYDWLYNELSETTRTKAANTLLNFALKQAQAQNWNLNFYEATNNWNQVCNGGLVCAALASYESHPTEAKEIIEKAIASNAEALKVMYSPDGNYPEGSSYWCYGTIYQVLMLAALDSTLDSDSGLSNTPGFSRTAEYMLYMTGMNSRFFNYSDCAPAVTPALATWYFADKYKNPSLLYNELRVLADGKYTSSDESRLLPMLPAFANNIDLSAVAPPASKLWSGKGETPVVLIHTDWSYSDTDKYLGIKGGKGGSSHGHLDAGSFVYDAYGVRWSMDFGLQSYTTLETPLANLGGDLWDMGQNSMRWDVFRLNNLHHSTISINDAYHRVGGAATLTTTINSATELGAIFNLTDAVSDQAASAVRTVKIVDDRNLVVVDEIKARNDKAAKVRWCMATPAAPTIESNRIVLRSGSKTMYLSAVGDVKPVYKTWSTVGEHTYDASNPGTYLVGFEATVNAAQQATFTTTLTPQE
jgi:hypothetical protein